MLYEAVGDLNDAWVDYQRGYQIAPDNRSLQDALLRLAVRRGAADEIRETEKRWVARRRHQLKIRANWWCCLKMG